MRSLINIFRSRIIVATLPLALSLLVLIACTKNTSPPAEPDGPLPKAANSFEITSPSLKEGTMIDAKFTCDGQDLSPALAWTAPPTGTKSLVLIVDDPDAPSGLFTHWMFYGLSADLRTLAENVTKDVNVDSVGSQGKNDFDQVGYRGPCPPAGAPHHYRFRLFALDDLISLKAGATRAELDAAMVNHSLAEIRLTALYQRK